ncbi:hypothetical protein Dsin_005260 [Dipteronia sinensis]|uniref:Reverse transcriptase domain-containing protein n=1 Tax=Dipteronia sinensis TaxID=43782 RepID=A0AAE0EEG0_9ROSI|nr:hypothetical protein Dsin_005260 [Dipteronia sinensis]
MAIKLDMSKAYNKVKWVFIERMMLKLGFSKKWVNLIMRCVLSISYSFILNGEVCGSINPFRGLKHGDPLSSYIFLICVEGLTSLIWLAQVRGEINGFK